MYDGVILFHCFLTVFFYNDFDLISCVHFPNIPGYVVKLSSDPGVA